MAVADLSGTVTARYRYMAFGKRFNLTGGDPSRTDPSFQNRTYDAGLGIYDYRNRSFDPATGRFLQRDPQLDEQNLYNPYAGMGNNPVGNVDPMGDISLFDATKDGRITKGEILNLVLTSFEAAEIVKNAANTADIGNVRTVQSMTKEDRDLAAKATPLLSSKVKLRVEVRRANATKARYVLLAKYGGGGELTGSFYKLLRAANPLHYVLETGFVAGSGYEPVLQRSASKAQAFKELGYYFAVLLTGQFVMNKVANISLKMRMGKVSTSLPPKLRELINQRRIGKMNTSPKGRAFNSRISGRVGRMRGRLSSSTPKRMQVSFQRQAGHIKGTPQHALRIKQGKPTSTFFDRESGLNFTREAWVKGTPIGSQENMRLYEFGRPVGVGPRGGYQTQVRVSIDAKGRIHGSPWGPVYKGPLLTP
jgi:RHS repeat-associated protein